MTTNRRPLMGTSNILQLQDNGYKSTVSAISEIIDNSIQANAKNIDVILIRNNTKTSSEVIEEILILDDGEGMDQDVFDKALQMSSGTRKNAKSGLGKYGQGLPNASISQTKRVEVYTKAKNSPLLFNYIDLQEIYESGEPFLPNVTKVSEINIPIFKEKLLNFPEHGTVVRWVNPNKVRPKTAKTLGTHIERVAGRTYRYYIQGFQDKNGMEYKCNINILVFDYNGEKYSKHDFLCKPKIKAFDPMFLMKDTQAGSKPTSLLFSEPAERIFTVEYDNQEIETEVTIKISYCPRSERNKHGRNAGSSDFGKMYLQRNLGSGNDYKNISIIRAGREIDTGGFGFVRDVSDPRERWWSAEVTIEPIIDSIIGIDNKKQQASNLKFLNSEEVSEQDHHEILHWISTCLEQNIKSVKNTIKADDATGANGGTSDNPEPKLPGGGVSEPGTPASPEKPSNQELEGALKELVDWIKPRYPDLSDEEMRREAEYALSLRDNHIFVKSDLGDTALYDFKVFGNKVLIEINVMHPFYDKFMRSFEEKEDYTSERAIRLLIGAMVNADIQVQTNDNKIISDRKKVKNRMFETLDDYITDLYS
ncbi:hypothetical protein B9T19_06515 [Ignatzschineria sp. F8392]|uniref:ATP-binding protein n=1 Tax=Ignatzschineria sp. F8392 TaxID=1980117 RepID=UPI000B989770|nr:ATP-binding protein [Ignatzschineria sp. F8392]OYQ79421.1 hypothetical protein B9T19_06515 [Ignatzschineria sp. F8392]